MNQTNNIQIKKKKNQRDVMLGFGGPTQTTFRGEKHFF